jgi:hypothetical protein
MGAEISPHTREELLEALRHHYHDSSGKAKAMILKCKIAFKSQIFYIPSAQTVENKYSSAPTLTKGLKKVALQDFVWVSSRACGICPFVYAP